VRVSAPIICQNHTGARDYFLDTLFNLLSGAIAKKNIKHHPSWMANELDGKQRTDLDGKQRIDLDNNKIEKVQRTRNSEGNEK
jgi:hypothetical protein